MTKRNIDLLSNRDMFVKYANVVEVARNAKIKIWHTGGNNCVMYEGIKEGKHIFTIKSATPNVKGIEKFVGIIHELSHVLFQSPFNASKKLLKDYWKLEGERYQLFFNAFNVLEDQRIESQMGKMYLKHASRFDKTTKKLGILMKQETLMMDNPVNMLLSIRFQRGDDITSLDNFDVYKKALDDVILTDKFGALRVLVSIKPYIDKWLDKKEQIMNDLLTMFDEEDNKKGSKFNRDTDNTDRQFIENSRDSSGEEDDAEPPDEVKDSIMMEDDIEEMLDINKNNGRNVVSDIFDSLRNDGHVRRLPKNMVMVKRINEKVSVDYVISKGMSKVFKTLMMRHSDFIDYDGEEVDVDAFVDGLIRGNDMGNCRINKKIIHGVSMVISIDGSSSMDGERINNARKLVATMFESVKHLDNVDIRANVWGGNTYGKVGMTEINNISDIKNVSIRSLDGVYYTTPIHMALEHSATMLKHMKGSKKMMIIITDGVPNHFNAGYHIAMNTYIKSCKKSLLKAMNVTPNIMCIVIQPDYAYKYNPIRQLFKSTKIMNVETMNKASERVIKRFKQMVMRSLV